MGADDSLQLLSSYLLKYVMPSVLFMLFHDAVCTCHSGYYLVRG